MSLCLYLFCSALLCVHSSFAIILKRKRKLVALQLLSYRCIVTMIFLWLFLTVPWFCLQCVIVVFPIHINSLFALLLVSCYCKCSMTLPHCAVGGLWCVSVVFPDHTCLLFKSYLHDGWTRILIIVQTRGWYHIISINPFCKSSSLIWFIVFTVGSQAIFSKRCCIFSVKIRLGYANSVGPGEMWRYATFYPSIPCLSKLPVFKRLNMALTIVNRVDPNFSHTRSGFPLYSPMLDSKKSTMSLRVTRLDRKIRPKDHN